MRLLWRTLPRGLFTALTVGLTASMRTTDAQTPTTQADSAALAVAIYRVAFTNGTHTAHAATLPDVVCVQGQRPGVDPSPAILDSLQEGRSSLVRPMSACKIQALRGSPRGVSLVVDTLTGKRGITVWAGEPTFAADGSFTVDTRYYQHGLSAGDWRCKGRRRSDQGWEITSCTLLRIS